MKAAMTLRALLYPVTDLAAWPWFRKVVGGHWSRWWIDYGVNSAMWFHGLALEERPGGPTGCHLLEREVPT